QEPRPPAAPAPRRDPPAKPQPASVEAVARHLHGGETEAALRAAAQFVAESANPAQLTALAATLRRHKVGDDLDSWLPAKGRGAVLLRWLYRRLPADQLSQSGMNERDAHRWAGLLALHENDWAAARELLRSVGGPELLLAHFLSGDSEAALALVEPLDVLVA